jgi:hypothetical protein
MIPPRQHWAIQIEITNDCRMGCSNCTRLCAHVSEPYHMPVDQYRTCVEAVAEFPYDSEPNPDGQNGGVKVVGMMGGEPLLHPEFGFLCEILMEVIPDRKHRGLWTAIPKTDRRFAAWAETIEETFGYLNLVPDKSEVLHQPILIASQDVLPADEDLRNKLIDDCWVQRTWSSSINPKGFYFCEVAAAMAITMGGSGGFPITPACWRHDLADYRHQREEFCHRCGACLPPDAGGRFGRRPARQSIDDVSPTNRRLLLAMGSPRILHGDFVEHTGPYAPNWTDWQPNRYLQ